MVFLKVLNSVKDLVVFNIGITFDLFIKENETFIYLLILRDYVCFLCQAL